MAPSKHKFPFLFWEIYITIHQWEKFCLLETLLFTFQIQWILGKINDFSYTIIVMLKPCQKYPPTLRQLS